MLSRATVFDRIHHTTLSHRNNTEGHYVGYLRSTVPTQRQRILSTIQVLMGANDLTPRFVQVYGPRCYLNEVTSQFKCPVQAVFCDDPMRIGIYVWASQYPLADFSVRTGTGNLAATGSGSGHLRIGSLCEYLANSTGQLVRTWFYNTNILGWYDHFNAARERGYNAALPEGRIAPASTCVGIPSQHDRLSDCAAAAIAYTGAGTVTRLDSPLQPEPEEYGSGFARATEVRDSELRRIFVSGTASIDADGKTIPEDAAHQFIFTLPIIGRMMEKHNFGWEDVTRCVIYAPHPEALGEVAPFLPSGVPIIICRAVICRDDLEVEIELDAVQQVR